MSTMEGILIETGSFAPVGVFAGLFLLVSTSAEILTTSGEPRWRRENQMGTDGQRRGRIPMIMIKRVYDPASEGDGERILVDRIWPRGLTKEAARVSSWMKELGPTTELRKWFGHDPSRWEEFRRRYAGELQALDRQALLGGLAERSRQGVVTLVFGARDREHNHAIVLKNIIEEIARKAA